MFQTPAIGEAIAKIRTVISLKQGLACIFGDNGFGKSSLLRLIDASYSADENFRVAMLAHKNSDISPFAFLKEISKEFDVPAQRSRIAQMDAIEGFLDEQHANGKTVLLLVDEAQHLPAETMEVVRALLNYETNTEKLCQIVLTGELALRDRMLTKKYKAFKSRIVAPVVLELFTPEETIDMIAHRHAHWRVPNKFTREASLRVHELTHGVPRDMVVLCGWALEISEASDLKVIDPETIDRAHEKMAMASDRESVEVAAV